MMLFKDDVSKVILGNLILSFHRKPLPEYVIQRVTRMILQELEALHSEGNVHCNINPAKILLFPSKSTLGEPFDLKLPAPHSGSILLDNAEYMSPESIETQGWIDSALDIYSLGCVVCEMFGGFPHQPKGFGDYEWYLFNDISPVAKDFLNRCDGLHPKQTLWLQKRPDRVRATAAELLNHPFITQKLSTLPSPTTSQ